MANYRGMDGSVTWAAGVVGEIKSWSAQSEVEALDDTAMGDKWRTLKGGRGQWRATITCHLDYGDTAQKAMTDQVIGATPGGAVAAVELLISGTTKKLVGSGLVSQASINQQLGNIVELQLQVEGSGQLAMTWS